LRLRWSVHSLELLIDRAANLLDVLSVSGRGLLGDRIGEVGNEPREIVLIFAADFGENAQEMRFDRGQDQTEDPCHLRHAATLDHAEHDGKFSGVRRNCLEMS
jgi:hypothetical protein